MRLNKRIIFLTLLAALSAGFFVFSIAYAQSAPPLDLGLDKAAETGLVNTDLRLTVARVIRVMLSFLGIIAVVLMMYAGFLYMKAGGNEDQVSTAKKIMLNGAIGLAIILSSYAITSFIINKLVEATTGGGTDVGTVGTEPGDGGSTFSVNQFYVSSLPGATRMCVRNVNLAITFNKAVDLATVQGNIVVRTRSAENSVVPGNWRFGPSNNMIVFSPEGSCAPSTGNDCLSADTDYELVFTNAAAIKTTENSDLTLNCIRGAGCRNVNFTSGSAVDRLPPTLNIITPENNSSESLNSTVPVRIEFTDDNGIQTLSLNARTGNNNSIFIDSYSSEQCRQSGTINLNWPTAGWPGGAYQLLANGLDFAGLSGMDEVNVNLRPSFCYNGVLDAEEDQIDCGGECGTCPGGSCSNNSDCSLGSECRSGTCQRVLLITGITPSSGGPGTFVTVSGMNFGSTAGKVYFAAKNNPDENNVSDWVEAKAPNCGSDFRFWTNNQIIIQVPTGTASSAYIKVESGVSRDVSPSVFTVNSQVKPGICSIAPITGRIGDPVQLNGKNFGLLGANDIVLFGSQRAAVRSNLNSPSWADAFIGISVPDVDAGIAAVKVVKNGVESNSVRFIVQPGASESSPMIESITPGSGARGEYITITGKNFGKERGFVWFKSTAESEPVIGSFNFPSMCEQNVWTDNKIIVKAPETGEISTSYYVQIRTSNEKVSPINSAVQFRFVSGAPAPGICAISPASGPIPLPQGQTISLWGENLSSIEGSSVYFWSAAATNPNSTTGRALATLSSSNSSLLTAVPSSITITGPASVYSGQKISNPVNFEVKDCTANGNSCGSGYQCCASGDQKGSCILNSQTCRGEKRFTGYIWRFSTRDIPPVPRVVERCNTLTEKGEALPSPSPSVQWNNENNDDSNKVCRTALVNVEFSAKVDEATVRNGITVNRCDSVENNTCSNPRPVQIDPASFELQSAYSDADEEHDYVSLSASNPWENGAWYQVVLSSGIRGANSEAPIALAADKPCGNGTAYCFYFRGGNDECRIRRIIVTPFSFWTEQLEAPLKKQTSSNTRETVDYRAAALSGQRCILMDNSNLALRWRSENTDYAGIYGRNDNSIANISSLANTVGVGLPNDSVQILASATQAGSSQTYDGASPLTIDLTKPKIFDWWPKCQDACTNAEVGVKFNVSLSNRNISNPGTVRLLKCFDDNCNTTVDVTNQASIQITENQPYNTIKIANNGVAPVETRGQNLLVNGFAEMRNNTNFVSSSYSSETHAGGGSFLFRDSGYFMGNQIIPVDPNKTYYLEGWVKSGDANGSNYDPNNRQYLGIAPLDADRFIISPNFIMKSPGSTDTRLARDLNPGDTTVVLENASGWYNGSRQYQREFIWYGYTNGQGYIYPDYTYSRNYTGNFSQYRIVSGEENAVEAGAWAPGGISGNVITLRAPWPGRKVSKGTAVRNSDAGSSYKYLGAINRPIGTTWTKASGRIGGIDTLGNNDLNKFPPGTEFVKIIFIVNYRGLGMNNNVRWSDFWFSDPSGGYAGGLEPNTNYKVIVSATSTDPLTSRNMIWSRATMQNASSYGKPYNQEFSWRFKTKNDSCSVNRVEMDPASYDAETINDRVIFTVQPYSAPDSCAAQGQKLNPAETLWTWNSSNSAVATISSFAARGQNQFCTVSCTKRGSVYALGAQNPTGTCGNGVVEAGEDCDGPNKNGNCGLDCRFITGRKAGSAVNPDSRNVSTATCGNGTIGTEEDCDLGIQASVSDNKSSLGCSDSCLHTGTPISSRWCNNYRSTRGGFDEAEYLAACAGAVSRCGNGAVEPDEDDGCDLGRGLKDESCDEYCLKKTECTPGNEGCSASGEFKGSSLAYSVPSVCGDGVRGIGEEAACEANLRAVPGIVSNPWALALGVGKAVPSGNPPAQRTNISATTRVGGIDVRGTGTYQITCGYKTDAECSAVGLNYGVGKDSCCYAKPSVNPPTVPGNGSSNICLNTVIQADFIGQIDESTLRNNFLIAKGVTNSSSCGAGEQKVTSSLFMSFENELPWYKQIISRTKNFIARIFGNYASAQIANVKVWCTGSDTGTAKVTNISTSTSRVMVSLQKPLAPDTAYAIILKEGIKDKRGVSIGKTDDGRNISWNFSTGSRICEIDSVSVEPPEWYFSRSGATTTLTAVAKSSAGSIQSIAGVYSWNYIWQPNDNAFVNLSNTNVAENIIASKNRNGELDVRAFAQITENRISSATGTVANGSSHISVFLCENPWPVKEVARSGQVLRVFPYEDSITNNDNFDLASNQFDGAQTPASRTIGDGYFNFSTHYCADNGSFGVTDDWPYLKPTVQVAERDLRVERGACESTGEICSVNSDCGVENGKQLECLKYPPFKRFIFSNDKNNDAIGIQIFPNPRHLTPEEWYRSDKALGGQGFLGKIQNTKVGGYNAASDGNNVYVAALNYSGGMIYDVIYLFSLSQNAKDETKHVFEELLKNVRFNTNLTYNDGYCGRTPTTPSYETKCDTDLECTNGEVCVNQLKKLQRNFQRLRDLREIDVTLQAFKTANGSYPAMREGSYISGQTVTTWPSWAVFGNNVSRSLPIDPVNKMGPSGTCKNNESAFCVNDSECPGSTCVIHDSVTGWSDVDRRFSFACASSSYAYRYSLESDGTYTLRAKFEDPGMPIGNLASFVPGFGFSDLNNIIGAFDWNNSSSGICSGATEISTINRGTCGDGLINGTTGEQCDPVGSKIYNNISSCTNDITTTGATSNVCQANCTWSATPTRVLCNAVLKCGNGIKETGEVCDDGQLNGRYNHCNTTCTGRSTQSCGDGIITSQYELCDTRQGLDPTRRIVFDNVSMVKYAPTSTLSCNWNCQSYGPYCGDGITQPQEACDGNVSCTTVDGRAGSKACSGSCTNLSATCVPLTEIRTTAAPGTCGDGEINDKEVCDKGDSNGIRCIPGYGQSCSYCSSDCKNVVNVQPSEYCGDGVNNGPEECDYGFERDGEGNGVTCVPGYGRACNYCSTGCKYFLIRPVEYCGDEKLQQEYEKCETSLGLDVPGVLTMFDNTLITSSTTNFKPGVIKYAPNQPDSCASNCQNFGPYCGDGVVQFEEQCDDGNKENVNDYCSNSCRYNPVPFVMGGADAMVFDNNNSVTSANNVSGGTYMKINGIQKTPYYWIALPNEDKVVKIRTSAYTVSSTGPRRSCVRAGGVVTDCFWDNSVTEQFGQVIGKYNSGGRKPSRIAVNAETGDVWVHNRFEQSVSKLTIDGVLMKTCSTTPSFNPGAYNSGTWYSGGGLAIAKNGDIWAGNYYTGQVVRIDGNDTSCTIRETLVVGGNPYGLVIDSEGKVWGKGGSQGAFRINPGSTGASSTVSHFPVPGFYGLAIDLNDNVWFSTWYYPNGSGGYRSGVQRLLKGASAGTAPTFFDIAGGYNATGMTIDSEGNIWNSMYSANQTQKIITYGSGAGSRFAGFPKLSGGSTPHGIVGDSEGHVWQSHQNNIIRVFDLNGNGVKDICPNGGTPPSCASAFLYTYSDMTGLNRAMVLRSGIWNLSTPYNSGTTTMVWANIAADKVTPPNTSIEIFVRASNNSSFTGVPFITEAVWNALPRNDSSRRGQYFDMKVILRSSDKGVTPVLSNIRFTSVP